MNIIALGPEGTNGHSVALRAQALYTADSSASIEFVDTNDGVLKRVGQGLDLGVVPIENGWEGWVREVVRYWLGTGKKPCVIGEVHVPIVHQLLAHPSVTDISQIRAVISHPQALGQCMGMLESFGIAETIAEKSTALAAKKVASGELKPDVAALAAPIAGQVYGLNVLKNHMEDDRENTTRFHVVGAKPRLPSGNDKTALLFFTQNKPRALVSALGCIETNMLTIHSIPRGQIGVFAFYVEFDGHMLDTEGRNTMKRLEKVTDNRIVLGSFPKELRS